VARASARIFTATVIAIVASSGRDQEFWHKVLKNLRAGLMPPVKKARPSYKEHDLLVHWLKYSATIEGGDVR
jgi:hypothetical protein